LYVINESRNDIYDNKYLYSLNNVLPNGYLQNNFKTISKIFEFNGNEDYQVIKTETNYTDDRLIILLNHRRNKDLNILRVFKINEPYDNNKMNIVFM
jgi:hypothetical protein